MSDNNINTKNRRNFYFPRNTPYKELDDFLRLNLPADIYFNPVDENLKKTQRLFSGVDAFEPLHIVYLLTIFKIYGTDFSNAYDFISNYGLKTNIYIHEINIINEWYRIFLKEFKSNDIIIFSEYEYVFKVLKNEFVRYFDIKNDTLENAKVINSENVIN